MNENHSNNNHKIKWSSLQIQHLESVLRIIDHNTGKDISKEFIFDILDLQNKSLRTLMTTRDDFCPSLLQKPNTPKNRIIKCISRKPSLPIPDLQLDNDMNKDNTIKHVSFDQKSTIQQNLKSTNLNNENSLQSINLNIQNNVNTSNLCNTIVPNFPINTNFIKTSTPLIINSAAQKSSLNLNLFYILL